MTNQPIPGAERPGATRPTPEQAAEIEALTAAATPGPWAVDTAYGLFVEAADGAPIADLNWAASTEAERQQIQANAEFIAAARTAVPALLAEMDAQSADLAAVSLAVARWRQGDQSATAALEEIEASVTAPDDEDGEGDD